MDVRNYDPAFPEWAGEPGQADMVYCGDVLEHIEPEYLDNVLDHIRDCARLGAILLPALIPARKHLADGRNAHLIVQPVGWWTKRISERFNILFCNEAEEAAMFVCETKE